MIGLGLEPKGFSVVKAYDDKYTGQFKLGDLFVVPCMPIYHAGVGCSEVEIIHFTQKPTPAESRGKAQHHVAH